MREPARGSSANPHALVGHREVTDAYLLSLVQERQGKLATLDEGITELIPARNERDRWVALI